MGQIGQGGVKRDAFVSFFDDVLDLPIWLEWLDGKILGYAADGIVGFFNLTGKDWYGKEVLLKTKVD